MPQDQVTMPKNQVTMTQTKKNDASRHVPRSKVTFLLENAKLRDRVFLLFGVPLLMSNNRDPKRGSHITRLGLEDFGSFGSFPGLGARRIRLRCCRTRLRCHETRVRHHETRLRCHKTESRCNKTRSRYYRIRVESNLTRLRCHRTRLRCRGTF